MARKKRYSRQKVGKGITKVVRRDGSVAYEVRCRDHTGKTIYLDAYPTYEEAVGKRRDYLDARTKVKNHQIPPPEARRTFNDLVDTWTKTLKNRTAYDDKLRVKHHLKPYFGPMKVDDMQSLQLMMRFIDDKRGEGKLKDATIRHLLNLLSRFFSWAIERGHAQHNPVRSIPQGKRPTQSPKLDRPWLDSDEQIVAIFRALPSPWDLMFLIGVTAGLRNGEIAGLRLSDCNFDERHLRVRYSYDGPLKESKPGKPKIKFAPMSDDVHVMLRQRVAGREAEEAGPEDYLFPSRTGKAFFDASGFDKQFKKVVAALDLPEDLTWYSATRHSFASRKLSRGVPLDEVSRAMGHASPTTTKRYYDHFIQRTFSPEMTRPVMPLADEEEEGEGNGDGGKVIPMRKAKNEK